MNQNTIGPAPPNVVTSDGKVVWYCFGKPLPELPEAFGAICLQTIEEAGATGFKPTTWEAAQEYLAEEQKKPKGSGRDLLREMCMFHILKLHSSQKIGFVSTSAKQVFELNEGATMIYPTVDLPPHIFGTPEDRRSPLLININFGSSAPATATIIMAYLTRTAKEIPRESPENVITLQLNHSPYN